jgi:hypothetical protein
MQNQIPPKLTVGQVCSLSFEKRRLLYDFEVQIKCHVSAMRQVLMPRVNEEELPIWVTGAADDLLSSLFEEVALWALNGSGDEPVSEPPEEEFILTTLEYDASEPFSISDVRHDRYYVGEDGQACVLREDVPRVQMQEWFANARGAEDMFPLTRESLPSSLVPYALVHATRWLSYGIVSADIKRCFPGWRKYVTPPLSEIELQEEWEWFDDPVDGAFLRQLLVRLLAPELPGYVQPAPLVGLLLSPEASTSAAAGPVSLGTWPGERSCTRATVRWMWTEESERQVDATGRPETRGEMRARQKWEKTVARLTAKSAVQEKIRLAAATLNISGAGRSPKVLQVQVPEAEEVMEDVSVEEMIRANVGDETPNITELTNVLFGEGSVDPAGAWLAEAEGPHRDLTNPEPGREEPFLPDGVRGSEGEELPVLPADAVATALAGRLN